MSGFQFLFSAALWALPLAGLPLLLHLLFRRKSPLLPFPTLRLVRASIQQTAARKKVQRWLLLATRMLLLALLIWAVAQPARFLAAQWFDPNRSLAAAIVLDTSYSMQLTQHQASLLDKAQGMVVELLGRQLKDAQVALYTSQPNAAMEKLQPATSILANWKSFGPQPGDKPLSERIAAAAELLRSQQAAQKWLIVLSDLQNREFPRPIPAIEEGRVILLDLHPDEARSAGITTVRIEPAEPIPGITVEAHVQVMGRAGETRAMVIDLATPQGQNLLSKPPAIASFNGGGIAQMRIALQLPAPRWQLLTARLQGEDAMAWDDTRSWLIEIPPQQNVSVMEGDETAGGAARYLRLALDPSEGKQANWPLKVSATDDLSSAHVVVVPGPRWPDGQMARKLTDFAKSGGTVICFAQPGLEELWPSLSAEARGAWEAILPSAPLATAPAERSWRATAASEKDPLLAEWMLDAGQLNNLVVRRLVAFSSQDANVRSLLNVAAGEGAGRQYGLLYRRNIGAGRVYTFATRPEPRYTNLPTHPIFLPLLVKMSLRPAGQSRQLNVELGQPLVLSAGRVGGLSQIELEGPRHVRFVLPVGDSQSGKQFVFADATEPGLYTWRKPGQAEALAYTCVSLPPRESDLNYRAAETVVPEGQSTLIARSLGELAQRMEQVGQPQPRWSTPIALVLCLLCLETLMGSVSKLWNPLKWNPMARQAA